MGALSMAQVSQLLWAAQGITDRQGFRTAPSAGALYPLELYLAVGNVDGLGAGLYRYEPDSHTLARMDDQDLRRRLARAALGQQWVADNAAVLIITGVYSRTQRKYGRRAQRYVHMEVGHAAQNVFLQAASLGLGTVVVGAFDDDAVARALGLSQGEQPLCLMPVGRLSAE